MSSSMKTEEKRVLSPVRILLLGASLLGIGALGFYNLPGMIVEGAKGSRAVNAIYCATITLTTIGYGEVCPGNLEPISRVFLLLYTFGCLGFFSTIMSLTSSWKHLVPGGTLALATVTLGLGMTLFTALEGLSQLEAAYASIITGTTIGYGDVTPSSDLGKIAVACYAMMVIPVVSLLLEPCRLFLENLCFVKRKNMTKKDD